MSGWNWQKVEQKVSKHFEQDFFLFENYSLSPSKISSKNSKRYSKNVQKTSASASMTMKMRLKMKNIFEGKFMKKLSKIEAELKKSVACKKKK